MYYSRINEIDKRKFEATADFLSSELAGVINELAAAVHEEADGRGRPVSLSEDTFACLIQEIAALGDDNALCKIATNPPAKNANIVEQSQSVIREAGNSCVVAKPNTPDPTPPTPQRTTKSPRIPRIRTQPAPTPILWRNATVAQKFATAVQVVDDMAGHTFSLNLSAKVQRTLVRSKAPVRLISTYINRELKAAGLSGTPYAFSMEYSPDSKLHLHGVIAGPKEGVTRALMAAGGKINGKAASRQVKLDAITGATGWAAYCVKDADRTWRHLDGDRHTFINADLLRLAREHWQERNQVKRRNRARAAVIEAAPDPTPIAVPVPLPAYRPRSGIPALIAEVAMLKSQSPVTNYLKNNINYQIPSCQDSPNRQQPTMLKPHLKVYE